ncbi:MAG: RNA-binding protein [Veillonellaceae bacterium]|jgi:RNA-binding protein YlmH|nr:RNA-binding protein [Veillonellaceae bacterium]
MTDREKILRFYRSQGDGDLAARLLDLVEYAIKYRRYKVTDFLDPHGFSIVDTIGAHYNQISIVSDGGYQGAERVRAAFVAEDYSGNVNFNIAAILISWDSLHYHITHRDVLGSLMGLGLKREVLGDIVLRHGACHVIVDDSLIEYLLQNLVSIGAAPVTATTADLSAIPPREERVKEIRTTVPSLRLDVIAAAGYGVSRTRMSDEIAADKIKVNWQNAKNSSQLIKAGDIISMRGRGRVEVCEIIGQTKKGRISILLKRFI